MRARRPDVLIGCWGVGVLKSSFRIFDSRWEGKPTGVIDLTGAKQWRDKYNNPAADLHPVFKRCNLNFGNPSVYWINNSKPSQLYAFLQEWEQGKLARPQVPNILSTWIQVEFVDNYPLSQYRFTDAKGKTRREDLKHQVPASSTYALSLFGHCVMDGLQCWEIGTRYSEELQDYSDWRVREPIVKRTINGVETSLNYYLKYFGFYNFHVLGMWQASQNKDIIEAATAWEMPETPHLENQCLARRRRALPELCELLQGTAGAHQALSRWQDAAGPGLQSPQQGRGAGSRQASRQRRRSMPLNWWATSRSSNAFLPRSLKSSALLLVAPQYSIERMRQRGSEKPQSPGAGVFPVLVELYCKLAT